MCRGYIQRGSIYHSESQFIGSGYQDTFAAESKVTAFKREADERGTPYVEINPLVAAYVDAEGDVCIKEMFSRMVKRDGDTVALFPFKRLSHKFIIAGHGRKFDPEKERRANKNLKEMIHRLKVRVQSFVNPSNPSAAAKAIHYIAALDEQLVECEKTDEIIGKLEIQLGEK
jgi:hypothetical protein